MSDLGQKDLIGGVPSYENFTATVAELSTLVADPVANNFLFDSVTGQPIDSGISLSIDQTFTNPLNTTISSSLAVATYVQANVAGLFKIQGNWDASTNTPTLTAGVGTVGFAYICTVAGTQTAPSGAPIEYNIGDTVYYASGIWNQIPAGNNVTSVNGQTGAVSLASTNLTDISNTAATSMQVLVNNGAGQYAPVSLSGGFTITTAGVATLGNVAVTGQLLTGLSTALNLLHPVATDSILQALSKLSSTAPTAYNVTHQTASYQFLVNNIAIIMDADAQNGTLPDATTVVPGVGYSLKLGEGANTGTLAVISGQSLNGALNGTYSIIGASNGVSAYSDGTGWYTV